ncbi:MAG: sulfatase [Planctomycetota bacterium]
MRQLLCHLLCLLLLAVNGVTLRGEEASRPNLLFLLADDLRFDALSSNGNEIVETPHLDRLARDGVSFDNAMVTTSICMISRASIMTGQHVGRHGVTEFGHQLSAEQLRASYFGRLKRAGYRLGFVGKWGVGAPPEYLFDYDCAYNGQGNYYGYPTTPDKHLTQFLGEQAEEFVETDDGARPFCLSVSFKAPHVDDGNAERPFNFDRRLSNLYESETIPDAPLSSDAFFAALPEMLRESENRIRWRHRFGTDELYQQSVKDYYRLIAGMDRAIGSMLNRLEEHGLAENTVVIFTSDHGFYLGERGFAGKWYPHEISLRIPLIVYDPRVARDSSTGDIEPNRPTAVALNIDIAPTLLDYAGVPIPQRMQGRSLRPFVEQRTVTDWREEFYYEHPFDYATIPYSEAVRTDRWKYIVYRDQSGACYEELYDFVSDPDEEHNLINDPAHRSELDSLRTRLRVLKQQASRETVARTPAN